MQALIAPIALCAAALWSLTYKKPKTGGGPTDYFDDEESEVSFDEPEPNEAYDTFDEIVVGQYPAVYANSKDFWDDVSVEDIREGHVSAPINNILNVIANAVDAFLYNAGIECDGHDDAEYHDIAWLALTSLPEETYDSEANFHQAAYRMLLSHFSDDSDESVSTENLWKMAKWCRNNGFLHARPYAHIKNLVRQDQDPENPVIDDGNVEFLQEGWETDSNTEVAYGVEGIEAFQPRADYDVPRDEYAPVPSGHGSTELKNLTNSASFRESRGS